MTMSPQTISQARRNAAARVLYDHPPGGANICACGAVWTPAHLAQVLDEAGCLGPYRALTLEYNPTDITAER